MSHTPGPWKLKKSSDSKTGFKGLSIVAGKDQEIFVANLVFQLDDKEVGNAKLMAAAPELLFSLQSILRNPTVLHHNHMKFEKPYDQFVDGCSRCDLQKLVVKANGLMP